ncbi:MAG: hypothetical protein RR247_02705 [Clostridia bacterium]
MIELKLTTSGKEQELIKQYLQENASETLAEKINNGVKIEKNNEILSSKKDLNGFMKFANDEARKLAKLQMERLARNKQFEEKENFQGACKTNTQPEEKRTLTKKCEVYSEPTCACVEDKTVFGWAIHYFEEDSIEGTLYNEDGTEYKPVVKPIAPKVEVKQPPKEEKKQASLFDFMDLSTNKQEKVEESEIEEEPCEDDDWTEEEEKEIIEQEQVVENKQVIDTETGEVIEPRTNKTISIDKEFAIMLYTLLDGKLEAK